jgi:hypothetical protein
MAMISARENPIIMTEITDPATIADMNTQFERMRKNTDWLQALGPTVYRENRGKHICVCGKELFVGDSAAVVLERARAAHPEDNGYILHYIPRERMDRIYAHWRTVAAP